MATFEGRYDAPSGALTITTAPSAPAAGIASWMPYTPWPDGIPNSGPKNTFEIRNGNIVGRSAACPGGAASWEGEVVLTSFFDAQDFTSVSVELTYLSPAGNEACNSDVGHDSLSATYGLWDYGAIAHGGTATRTWRFANPTSQSFTFRGRIMAQLGAVPAPANGATAFEWSPYMFADPPHSFQHQGTTLARVVWTGSAFVDLEGALDFQPAGTPAADNVVGIGYPEQHWAGPFTDGAVRYLATDTIGLRGDFTACVKMTPGVDPARNVHKVFLAKGNPVNEVGYGWALSHQRGDGQNYAIWYYSPGQTGSFDTFLSPNSDHPELWAFDYICGGRDGTNARVISHGREIRFPLGVGGPLPEPDTLPLAIGAEAAGTSPATDGGVYEVVIDSRPATLASAADIVNRAEGRRVYNGAAFWGNDVDGSPVVGADGVTYHFPFGATVPVSSDGSGLMDPGLSITIGIPNASYTLLAGNPAGWCVGAEVASATWTGVSGCVLGDVDGYLKLYFLGNGIAGTTGSGQWQASGGDWTQWAPNSRHKLMLCTEGPARNNAALYVDGAVVGTSSESGPQYDPTGKQLFLGRCYYSIGALTGARIGRVFACPTNDHTLCN